MRPSASKSSEPIALSPASPRVSVRSDTRAPSPLLNIASIPPCSSSGCAVVCMTLAIVCSLRSFCQVPLAPRSCGSGSAAATSAAEATAVTSVVNRRVKARYDTVPAVLDLITAGEAFDDYVFHGLARPPRLGEEIRTDRLLRSPGGGAVITAIAASRLGLQCGMFGGVSRQAVRLLRREGVRVRNLRRDGEPAPITVAMSTPEDRAFVTFNGMNGRLPGRLRQAIRGVRARHVHFAFGPPQCRPWRAVVRSLRRRGIGTSWDFGWYPRLQADPHFWSLATMVDYLFVNRDEAIAYAPRA